MKHTNSKHREAAANLPTPESGKVKEDQNRLSLESLAAIVEAIKTSLITKDLYGLEINTVVKNASCSKALFDAVLPLYDKFSRKKNQKSRNRKNECDEQLQALLQSLKSTESDNKQRRSCCS